MSSDPATQQVQMQRVTLPQTVVEKTDVVAREEPLEIRVEGRSVAVVMRTPGHDEELAAGFLVTEGVVRSAREILEISQCPSTENQHGNVVDVLLAGGAVVDWQNLTRHVFSASSCGICGKTSIESVFQNFPPVPALECPLRVDAELLAGLPEALRAAQEAFTLTGGLHASAVFDARGRMLVIREDVGRHNALDKVIGWALREGHLPLHQHLLLVSGRVSFEIMQKALAAGLPLVAAVSAPSSLAVEFAQQSGQTLVGFLRGREMNLYAHPWRVSSGLAGAHS
ncbi:MAG: formate dehydrogenase accessory sulfurtransferase FdhD [Prosthecobacter sp.]|jgi:FdhD protein|nr:formate dehydrogenase accessory sulfurtransferase FdhD [Prosthecobacter sp.]